MSYCESESIIMKPEYSVMQEEYCEYPFSIPEVTLDGFWEEYGPLKNIFSWGAESIVLVRDNKTIRYTTTLFTEILIKDEDGNTSWIDCRMVPSVSADIVEQREAKEFTIEEYDYDQFEKKKYKVMLEETSPLDRPELEIDSSKFNPDVIGPDKPIRTIGGFSF